MMKKFAITLFAALCVFASASANSDIKDLLKGAAGALGGQSAGTEQGSGNGSSILSGLQGLVEGVISKSDLTEADLVGTYVYSAPAVSFNSSDLLKKAGGAAAAGVLEGKMAPYYQRVGLNNLQVTFNEDKTFTFTIKRLKLSGTFEKDAESANGDFLFHFTAVSSIPLGTFKGHVEKVGSKLNLTFDASKLITLVNSIASLSGRKSLQTVASLLNSYDGLNCGFELSPVK